MTKEWIAVLRAADAAARWHVHQRHKGVAEEPYVNHLLEVATARSGVVAIDSIFNIIEPMKREGRPVGRRHLISVVVGDERAADGTINCRESGSARGQIEKLSVGVKLMHAHPRRRESLTCRS